MLGSLDKSEKSVTVVGGGAAGLLAAYYLGRSGFDVKLFEASDRLGGLLETQSTEHAVVERAANSLVRTDELERLCNEIGVELEPIAAHSTAKYILRGGRLRSFPLRIWEAFVLGLRGVFVRARDDAASMSAYDWACRHLGRAAADYLIQPMVTGIYGARAQDLCWHAAFPSLALPPGWALFPWLLFGRKKSTQGKRIVVAPRGGMTAWTQALAAKLDDMPNVEVNLNQRIDDLPKSSNTILSVPAHQAAELVDDEELAASLRSVIYTPMVSIGVVLRSEEARQKLLGLGTLIPPSEDRKLLGVLFSSACFSGKVKREGDTLVTCMVGGGWRPELLSLSDAELGELVAIELREIFGIDERPVELTITRWPKGIPQYSSALTQVWQATRRGWCATPGRVLFSNYTGDVSLRGMLERASIEFGRA